MSKDEIAALRMHPLQPDATLASIEAKLRAEIVAAKLSAQIALRGLGLLTSEAWREWSETVDIATADLFREIAARDAALAVRETAFAFPLTRKGVEAWTGQLPGCTKKDQ